MMHILDEIRERFGAEWQNEQRPDLLQIGVQAKTIVPLLTWLKAHTPFVQLTHLSAVDWIEDGEFQLTYLLTDPKAHVSLMVCTRIDREQAEAESIHALWPQAVTYEQEINEMFGIHFPGSPRQGVPFILEGWNDIPPMRRDFDTVAYMNSHHPSRPGREHTDPRAYIGKVFGERGYLHDDD